MKLAALAFCLALAACISPDYDTSWPDPQKTDRTASGPTYNRDDIQIEQDQTRDAVADTQGAAEQCARYGRVASRNSHDRYSCVSAGEAVDRSRRAW